MKWLNNPVVRHLIIFAAVSILISYLFISYVLLPFSNYMQHQLYEMETNQTYAKQQCEQLNQFLGSQTFFIISFTFFLVSDIALLIVVSRQR